MQLKMYDVVVIGSGLGGMCAAALLVKEGYKTIVVESQNILGGRFSTEDIEGYKVATGGVGIQYSGWVPKVFKEVGAKLELRARPEVFYRLKGQEFHAPRKYRGLLALLDILEKMEVDRAKKVVGSIVKEVASEKIRIAFQREVSEQGKEGGPTLQEWLLRYTDNEDVLRIFDAMTINMAMGHVYEITASAFFIFMATMKGMADAGMAPRGSLSLIEELAKVIRTNGDVWNNCPTKQILSKNGTATGVVVQKDGSEVEISCHVVVSDVGPKQTVTLAGGSNFSEKYLTEMRIRMKPLPFVLVHIASDKPLCIEGGEPGLLWPVGTRRITVAVPMTNTCPELAPRGQHLLYCLASPPSTLAHINTDEEVRQVTLDLQELFPDFKKYGRILKMVVRDLDDDMPEGHTWQAKGYCMPRETPLRNLFNVGDGVQSPGYAGTNGCAEGAKRVVESIKKSIKPGNS